MATYMLKPKFTPSPIRNKNIVMHWLSPYDIDYDSNSLKVSIKLTNFLNIFIEKNFSPLKKYTKVINYSPSLYFSPSIIFVYNLKIRKNQRKYVEEYLQKIVNLYKEMLISLNFLFLQNITIVSNLNLIFKNTPCCINSTNEIYNNLNELKSFVEVFDNVFYNYKGNKVLVDLKIDIHIVNFYKHFLSSDFKVKKCFFLYLKKVFHHLNQILDICKKI